MDEYHKHISAFEVQFVVVFSMIIDNGSHTKGLCMINQLKSYTLLLLVLFLKAVSSLTLAFSKTFHSANRKKLDTSPFSGFFKID